MWISYISSSTSGVQMAACGSRWQVDGAQQLLLQAIVLRQQWQTLQGCTAAQGMVAGELQVQPVHAGAGGDSASRWLRKAVWC